MNILGKLPSKEAGCGACRFEEGAPFPFKIAFQPIVSREGVFAYEALVRGPGGESAGTVLAQVNSTNLYAFDQACRVRAIETASCLGLETPSKVSINFIPGAVYKPAACIRKTLDAASRVGMDCSDIILEVTESEQITDRPHLIEIFQEYRRCGLQTAIDDFGAGYAGLDLLAAFQPDILKLDMSLIRNLDERRPSRLIVAAVLHLCRDLGTRLIAEGVETMAEFHVLEDLGVELFQGYLFGRPALEALETATLPSDRTERASAVVGVRTAHLSAPGVLSAEAQREGPRG